MEPERVGLSSPGIVIELIGRRDATRRTWLWLVRFILSLHILFAVCVPATVLFLSTLDLLRHRISVGDWLLGNLTFASAGVLFLIVPVLAWSCYATAIDLSQDGTCHVVTLFWRKFVVHSIERTWHCNVLCDSVACMLCHTEGKRHAHWIVLHGSRATVQHALTIMNRLFSRGQ